MNRCVAGLMAGLLGEIKSIFILCGSTMLKDLDKGDTFVNDEINYQRRLIL